MTTDNRANEPTEAMILAGLNAYSSKGLEIDGYEMTEEYPSLEMWGAGLCLRCVPLSKPRPVSVMLHSRR